MNHLYQYSTMGALVGGMFDGVFSIDDVLKNGNYGIGTLEGLNGELFIKEGIAYVIESSGTIREVALGERSPFASVTFFESQKTLKITEALTKEQLDIEMLQAIEGMNSFHAVKVTGTFKTIKARAAKKQESPYPKLVEAVKAQGYFDFEDTTGTLFGFYTPRFIQGIGVAGYHVHYLSDDLRSGGHVFDFVTDDVTVELALMNEVTMMMPDTPRYRHNDLNDPDMLSDIEASE